MYGSHRADPNGSGPEFSSRRAIPLTGDHLDAARVSRPGSPLRGRSFRRNRAANRENFGGMGRNERRRDFFEYLSNSDYLAAGKAVIEKAARNLGFR